jgi:hypothetical protein
MGFIPPADVIVAGDVVPADPMGTPPCPPTEDAAAPLPAAPAGLLLDGPPALPYVSGGSEAVGSSDAQANPMGKQATAK